MKKDKGDSNDGDEPKVRHFSYSDICNFASFTLFNKKWIILENLGKRGESHCYSVADKSVTKFGTLYLEICAEGMSMLSEKIEFLHKQYSVGNSHRFCTILDTDLLNDHLIYMVTMDRAGPSLDKLLDCRKADSNDCRLSAKTTAFVAIDIVQTIDILVSTGYVLRNFDARQWKFDVKSRIVYLVDPTDIGPITDKRYRVCNENAMKLAKNLHWNGTLLYAPVDYHKNGEKHQMSEMDMVEMSMMVIYDLGIDNLPWKDMGKTKVLEKKMEFFKAIPDLSKESDGKLIHFVIVKMLARLKEARRCEQNFTKLPVRDGAWCPNGHRAGALITPINYTGVIEDWRRVVTGNAAIHVFHWRDLVLDWEKVVDVPPDCRKRLFGQEQLFVIEELEAESQRLAAKRRHYEIMEKHSELENNLNQIEISAYLMDGFDENTADNRGKHTKDDSAPRRGQQIRIESPTKEDGEEEKISSAN